MPQAIKNSDATKNSLRTALQGFTAKNTLHSGSTSPNTNNQKMRKRHWLLGLSVILGGSWITHTTTATIATPAKISEQTSIVDQQVESKGILTQEASERLIEIDTQEQTDSALAIVKPAQAADIFTSKYHTVKKGESLGIIFRKKTLNMSLPYKISQHELASKLVSLSIGKQLEFQFDQSDELRAVHYPITALKQLKVSFENSEITDAKVEDIAYQTLQKKISAEINSSLYLSAAEAGLSNNLIMEMVRIFGWDVDFVQDIRRGDSFHVIYDEHQLNGIKLSDGNILAAEFTTQGQTYRAIRFEDKDGTASYYTPEGESMLGTFLRSPVEFSRISSRFGRRKHPISKKWRAHKGVDYAAARGTPIRATADGKVKSAGRKGGYGNTVVLTHAGRFSTLYAHMKGFAKGIRSGSKVKQGQVIGYVGTTGYSTGPHLHYEFRVDGVHRNSLTYKTPKASSVDSSLQQDFKLLASTREKELDSLSQNYQLAKVDINKSVRK